MDLISPLACPPEDRPQLPAARAILVEELERRGRLALAALIPVLALLWVTLRRAASEDRRIGWLLLSVLAAGSLRILLHRWKAATPEARHLWFSAGSTAVALLLSATIWLAFSRLTAMETGLLGMIAAGLGSGALVSMAPSPITYLAYLIPIVGSLALASFLHPVPEHPRVFQALAWLYLAGLGSLSLQVHKSLRDEILLGLKSQELAWHDALTGLHNRRFLQEFMEHETAQALRGWGQANGRPLSLKLLIIDIDHFKRVNDQHGHDAGDAVLKQMAALLRDIVRKPDIVVRWGGEEFVIVARDTGRELPMGLAERIRRRVADHAFLISGGTALSLTCSIGFSLYPFLPPAPQQITWDQCIALADTGLYLAKEEGRDRWVGVEAGQEPWDEAGEAFQAVRASPAQALERGMVKLVRQEP